MKATGLRIGNILSFSGEPVAINAGFIHDCDYWNKNPERQDAVSFENVEPIPLTDEWLEKLGALKDEYGDVFIEIDSDSDTRLYLSTRGYIQLVKSYHCPMFDYEHIRYVHQLQNLFFCLCGEELHIKNKWLVLNKL